MFGRKQELNTDWKTRATQAGKDVYTQTTQLADSIQDNPELRFQCYCAALLFVTLDLAAYFALDKQGRKGHEPFIAHAQASFMDSIIEHMQLTKLEAESTVNYIAEYMETLRRDLQETQPKGSMLKVTQSLCEVFANLAMNEFNLTHEQAVGAVNEASKAVSTMSAKSKSMIDG